LTVAEEFASIAFVTPALAMLIVPLPVIGPPVNPAPVATLVTVPLPDPGKVCPEANVITPLCPIESPVSAGVVPFEPNNKFNVPEGLLVSFPEGSACHRKSCVTAADVLLLYDDAWKSNGFEMYPLLAVDVPVVGINPPIAVSNPLNVPVVPFKPPVSVPPANCR
jgi:hypothetical protein